MKIMTAKKKICDYVADFIEDYHENIVYDVRDSSLPKKKEAFIEEIRKDVQVALWVIFELANWGMDKKYLEELIYKEADDDGSTILKIKDSFFNISFDSSYNYIIKEVKRKTKMVEVEYFE